MRAFIYTTLGGQEKVRVELSGGIILVDKKVDVCPKCKVKHMDLVPLMSRVMRTTLAADYFQRQYLAKHDIKKACECEEETV